MIFGMPWKIQGAINAGEVVGLAALENLQAFRL